MNRRQISSRTASIAMLLICTLSLACGGGGGGGGGGVITPGGVDLRITKDDGGVTLTLGGTISYTLTYSNVGSGSVTGVVISETVPDNTTFNAAGSSAGWSCAGTSAGSSCTFAVGSLASSASGTTTFAVNVAASLPVGVSSIVNTASIADDASNGAEMTPADNTATETTMSLSSTFTADNSTPGPMTLSMAPGNASGPLFDVEVRVTGIDNFFGAAFRVNFDPSSASFIGASGSGSFLAQLGVTTEFTATPGAAGELLVTATRRGQFAGVSQTGTELLITLSFTASGPTGGNAFTFGPAATREVQTCPSASGACDPPVADGTLTWSGGMLVAN